MKSETTGEGKLNTIDKLQSKQMRNDVVEDKRSLTYYLLTTKQIINHTYYSLSYYEEYEQAEWVAYELKSSYLKNNDFKGLILLKIIWSAQALQIGDYRNSCFEGFIYVQLLTWNLM
jgi:hypothetical protein